MTLYNFVSLSEGDAQAEGSFAITSTIFYFLEKIILKLVTYTLYLVSILSFLKLSFPLFLLNFSKYLYYFSYFSFSFSSSSSSSSSFSVLRALQRWDSLDLSPPFLLSPAIFPNSMAIVPFFLLYPLYHPYNFSLIFLLYFSL